MKLRTWVSVQLLAAYITKHGIALHPDMDYVIEVVDRILQKCEENPDEQVKIEPVDNSPPIDRFKDLGE